MCAKHFDLSSAVGHSVSVHMFEMQQPTFAGLLPAHIGRRLFLRASICWRPPCCALHAMTVKLHAGELQQLPFRRVWDDLALRTFLKAWV